MLAQIELHKLLVARVNNHPDDDDLLPNGLCDAEAAIQALGDIMPTTVASAAAQRRYMADVEDTFATGGLPLLRTVPTVAQVLAG